MSEISMQQLKEQRLTPAEKFVLDKVKGAKACEPNEDGIIYFEKDGISLFGQDFYLGCLAISVGEIQLVLEGKYGLNHKEIQEMLTKLLYKYTNDGELRIFLLPK